MNLQSWGLNWFQQQRERYMTESVLIIHLGGTKTVNASIIEPQTEVSFNGLRTRSDKTLFIIKTTFLNGLTVKRGVRITRLTSGDTYEVILDKSQPHYFNDPNRIDTVIPTRLICS